MRGLPVVLVVVAATTLLSGCGGDEFPAGAYVSTADVNNLGPVTVTFEDDGKLRVVQGAVTSDGTWKADGDQVTLSDEYCKLETQESAVYTWKWDGATLTLTTTKDSCSSRVETVREMKPAG